MKQLLSEQRLNYDFGFGCTADWEVDTPALLLSRKKSIFGVRALQCSPVCSRFVPQCDLRVTLKPNSGQSVAGALPTVSHELLSMWRMFVPCKLPASANF